MRANWVADPVVWYTQTPSAKLVSPEPTIEKNWAAQIRRKMPMPLDWFLVGFPTFYEEDQEFCILHWAAVFSTFASSQACSAVMKILVSPARNSLSPSGQSSRKVMQTLSAKSESL